MSETILIVLPLPLRRIGELIEALQQLISRKKEDEKEEENEEEKEDSCSEEDSKIGTLIPSINSNRCGKGLGGGDRRRGLGGGWDLGEGLGEGIRSGSIWERRHLHACLFPQECNLKDLFVLLPAQPPPPAPVHRVCSCSQQSLSGSPTPSHTTG